MSLFASKYRNIGLKIAYYRKLKNLTQVELAEKVGISSKYLSRIETGGTSGAALDIYFKICLELGVNFEDLTKDS